MTKIKSALFNSHFYHTLWIMLAAVMLGIHWYVALLVTTFWFSREYAQAQQRWLIQNRTTWANLPAFAGFRSESWNYKSLWEDLVYPVILAVLLAALATYFR
jgi:hypothetical protein